MCVKVQSFERVRGIFSKTKKKRIIKSRLYKAMNKDSHSNVYKSGVEVNNAV